MSAAMRRALAAGAIALIAREAVQLVASSAFCRPHQAWSARREDPSVVVLDGGERIARTGDAIYTCETAHQSGPFVLHQDLICVCAPTTLTVEQVAQATGGSCRLDHAFPQLTDQTGGCRFARCERYVDR